jgi:glycosyltransferase involved in cell wall biosynthesis
LNEPLVSIGIPVYNGEEYLAQALDSVLGQDYSNLEIVISDNASTDGTSELCRRYAAADRRIRYFRNESNLGVVRNFGQAVLRSSGTYFMWLAHDDLLVGISAVRRLADFLDRNPDVVLSGSGVQLMDYVDPALVTPKHFPDIQPERDWREACMEFFTWPQRECASYVFYGMYRRVELSRVPFRPRMRHGEETILDMEVPILLPLLRAGRAVALPETMRAIRLHERQSSVTFRKALSTEDKILQGLHTRFAMLRNALQPRLPIKDKLAVIRRALSNFRVVVLGYPQDEEFLKAEHRRELAKVYTTCDQRLQVIEEQEVRIGKLETVARERLVRMEESARMLARNQREVQEFAAVCQERLQVIQEQDVRIRKLEGIAEERLLEMQAKDRRAEMLETAARERLSIITNSGNRPQETEERQ